MSTARLPSGTRPETAPAPSLPTIKSPSLADAAAVLLPGLEQARSMLDVSIRVLRELSGYTAHQPRDAAAEALKARRLIAAFGRVPKSG